MVRLGFAALAIALVVAACSDDSSSGGGGGHAGTSGQGATGAKSGTGASAGTGGNAGIDGSAGSTGGSAGSTGGSAGSSGGSGGAAGAPGSGGGAGSDGSAGAAGSPSDAGSDAPAVPLPGFGTITGDCGPIDPTEILSTSPYSFETVIDFGTLAFDYNALSTGGKKIFDDGNLGGSSLESEIFSYEVLYRCELAALLKTEAEVAYTNIGGKKTDLLVQIDGYKVGVSVTRAFQYPPGSTFTVAAAQSLLDGKLSDILLSSANVMPADAWKKQILHVLAYNQQHRDAVFQAYPMLPPATRADTIVMVTVTNGNDDYIY